MRAVKLEYGWKEYFINQGKKEILKFSCIEGTVHKPREERKKQRYTICYKNILHIMFVEGKQFGR